MTFERETTDMNDVYERLRQRLDDMGPGFPATKKGIEIKILKQLFTEADAEMALMCPRCWRRRTASRCG
jgi:electron transport complex protein RnfB